MLVISRTENEVLKSIKYLFEYEMLDYNIESSYKETDDDKVIIIADNDFELPEDIYTDTLIISSKKVNISDYSKKSNVIITKLVNDNNTYSSAQEEFLFRDGIYSNINSLVLDFINDKTIDKVIYDTSCCKLQPKGFVFGFDSIAESYAWLSKKNKHIEKERKVIEIFNDVAFNDGDKEINYLSEYIVLAKKGMKITTIFMGTKEQLEERKKNRFFNLLTKETNDSVKNYFCDIDVFKERESELLSKIRDGIAIYEDCVYRDTLDSEFSLGLVDCKEESIKEYNGIFDYILSNYCVPFINGGDSNGLQG